MLFTRCVHVRNYTYFRTKKNLFLQNFLPNEHWVGYLHEMHRQKDLLFIMQICNNFFLSLPGNRALNGSAPCENSHVEIIVPFTFPHIASFNTHLHKMRHSKSYGTGPVCTYDSGFFDATFPTSRVAQQSQRRTKRMDVKKVRNEDNDLIISHIDTFINTMGIHGNSKHH